MADADPSSCVIDDAGPFPVVRPASVGELGDVVRRAAADGLALYPVGGRTALDLGLPPARPGLAVDTTALAAVIDYPARDLTVTVQAGIPLDALRRLLATEGQRLPVDVPRPESATLGGALAVNASGPRRLGFGTLRDYVIGISTVNDDGQETKAGGRVVKNVAGYDLCKLHVGALGTLGIISQVTLKLRPLPEETTLLTLGCDGAALAELLDSLHRSRTRPVCLDVLNPAAARALTETAGPGLPDAAWAVVLGYEDSRETVNWQVRQLLEELPPRRVRGLDVRSAATAADLWRALIEFPTRGLGRASEAAPAVTFRAGLLPSVIASFCLEAAALPAEVQLQAHAGSGIVLGHLEGDLTAARVQEMLKGLQAQVVSARGHLTLPRCPAPWKKEFPVWGPPRGDWALMRQVKERLDPRRLFNPGRFIEGI
jgi:glycolate oxidase FAD binding subunit